MTKTKTTTKTTTKTKKPAATTTEPRVWTRTVTLPFGFDHTRPTVSLCSSADGAWFLVEPHNGAVIGQLVRDRDLEIAREDGSINLVIPLLDCGFGLPFTALAPLRRVFPAWRVSGDMQTWERVFEMEAFITALRIS